MNILGSARLFWKPFKSIKSIFLRSRFTVMPVSAALISAWARCTAIWTPWLITIWSAALAWSAVPNALTGTPTPMSIFTAASATRSLTLICRKASWTPWSKMFPTCVLKATAWPWPAFAPNVPAKNNFAGTKRHCPTLAGSILPTCHHLFLSALPRFCGEELFCTLWHFSASFFNCDMRALCGKYSISWIKMQIVRFVFSLCAAKCKL